MMNTRLEKDSMGSMDVPESALYGAQTRRAELNFPVSGWMMPSNFVSALGLIKRACAKVNCELGKLSSEISGLIITSASEVADGKHNGQFVVDIFQTGSGTSSNMNANEVIANRAIQLAGGEVGSRNPVHPNDHVNMGQSSNDVIPTALHVSIVLAVRGNLLPTLASLRDVLSEKSEQFDGIVKIGRTHLQDATPIRLGQVFSGYSMQVRSAMKRIESGLGSLYELSIGGTAVGTGINTHFEFGRRVARALSEDTGYAFREAENHFAAQAAKSAVVEMAGHLKSLAIDLTKIANDIRFLASGPRCGIGELELPAIQPGSSIMPGKVNPVVCESLMQVAAYVVGAESAVSFSAATLSNFELSVAMPLMAHQMLESIRLLANGCTVFVDKMLRGLAANEKRCGELIEGSLAMCTSLAPIIGYDNAATIAKKAFADGKTVREVVEESGAIGEDGLNAALDPLSMTEPSME